MKLNFPSKCPVCSFQIKEPLDYCRRCGCYLLLLTKVQNEALKWREQGKEACAQAFDKPLNHATTE